MRDGRTRKYFATFNAKAFLTVPLITQEKPVGILGVDNAVSGHPSPETIQKHKVPVPYYLLYQETIRDLFFEATVRSHLK